MIACGDDEVGPKDSHGGSAGKSGNGGSGAKGGAVNDGDAGEGEGGAKAPTAGKANAGGQGGSDTDVEVAGAGGSEENGVGGSAGTVDSAGAGGIEGDPISGEGGYAGALEGGSGGAPDEPEEVGGSGGAGDGPPTDPAPTNLLVNPGFEEGWADGWTLDNPGGLSYWQVSVKENSEKARNGTKYLNIYFDPATAYEATASQIVTNVEEGYYKFSMFCQRNPFTALRLFAVGYDEANALDETTVEITDSAWPFAEVSIPVIHVTSGQVEVGIYAESDGTDTYAECDDAELIAVPAP